MIIALFNSFWHRSPFSCPLVFFPRAREVISPKFGVVTSLVTDRGFGRLMSQFNSRLSEFHLTPGEGIFFLVPCSPFHGGELCPLLL